MSNYKKISDAIKESHMWKPIDVLICNAGFVRSEYLENTSIEDLDLIIQTNLTGTLYTLHAALPLMKNRDGRPKPPGSIVLMCSLGSLVLPCILFIRFPWLGIQSDFDSIVRLLNIISP